MEKNHTHSVDQFRPLFFYFSLESHQLWPVVIRIGGFARRAVSMSARDFIPSRLWSRIRREVIKLDLPPPALPHPVCVLVDT
ncbi:hypothetical protein EVAR_4449_1 [Eumeta japonica]|uniref:Uncharacterized protein n=1 Tax=Eumeta variegata TaxID=151549 RepID=A0A4C1T0K1_EUMVA|nr:hypothetical protein EVAR_4449_1 [Eumeta japonica]